MYPFAGSKQPLEGLLDGLDANWFVRWNGLPGTVALGKLEGTALDGAEKILWAKEPKTGEGRMDYR